MPPGQEKTKYQLEAELKRAEEIIEQQEEKLRAYAWEVEQGQGKKGGQDLGSGEKALRNIADILPQLVSYVDQGLVYRFVNRAYEEFFECRADEIEGRKLQEIIGREAFEATIQYVRRALNGETVSYQADLNYPGKQMRKMDAVLIPDLSGTGRVKGYYAILHDVTHLKKIEEELSASEQKYRAIFENAPLGLFRSTPEGRFIEVNPALAHMLGYDSPREVLSEVTDIARQVYTDPVERLRLIEQQRSRSIKQDQTRLQRRDGSEFAAKLYLKTVGDKDGNPVYLEGIVEDVDELVKAEKLIVDLNKSLKNILDSMPADIYVVDPKSHEVLYMNKRMQKSYGKNCVGQTCYQSFQGTSAPCEDCNYLKMSGRLDNVDENLTWENYSSLLGRWYLNYDCPVPWADGRYVRIRIALDITQRKEAECSLQKAKENLEAYTKKLEEKNIALNVLLENRQEEKEKLSAEISANFDKLVLPYFERLKQSREKEELLTLVSIVETNIRESLSPLEKPALKAYKQLTPMEIQVADLIRSGKTSKEIANLLEISVRSVFFHRNNIRQKLNIQKTKTNLYSFLASLV